MLAVCKVLGFTILPVLTGTMSSIVSASPVTGHFP
uniref:Pre-mRNA-processing factor 19-like n=1 Tax=Rhizophora mucronata TaxID=61149 RepID=A0A2P2JLI4_RHIMU